MDIVQNITFAAEPNVEYVLELRQMTTGLGVYRMLVEPPPSVEVLAAQHPAPPHEPPNVEESDVQIAARVAALTVGWTVEPSVHGDLAAIPPMRWTLPRGRCIQAAIVTFAPGAELNWTPLAGLPFGVHLRMPQEARNLGGPLVTDLTHLYGDTHRMVAASGGGICFMRQGVVELVFAHNDSALTRVGTGTFQAQVYETSVAEEALRAIEQADSDRELGSRCVVCMHQRLACQHTGNTGTYATCEDLFNGCMGPSGPPCRP